LIRAREFRGDLRIAFSKVEIFFVEFGEREMSSETQNPPLACLNAKCGHENAAGADRCAKCGRLLPGNLTRQTHGVVTLERRGDGALPPGARRARQERIERMLVDLGGEDGLSQLSLGLVERAAQLSVMLDVYEADFEARGMWTARGRQRTSVATYLSILDRYDKLAQRLGLERRSKHVGDTLDIQGWMERVRRRAANGESV
jgi:hypothetical protein